MKKRTVAILLAIFLGGIGIHKFYQNRVGSGLVYLIFCWTGIPAFIALIEAIVYLTMSNEKYEAKYCGKTLSNEDIKMTIIDLGNTISDVEKIKATKKPRAKKVPVKKVTKK